MNFRPIKETYEDEFPLNNRIIDFGYYLLDSNNSFIKELNNVITGSVSYDMSSNIKRTAKFELIDDGTIDFIRHRVMPTVRIKNPSNISSSKYHVTHDELFFNPYHKLDVKDEAILDEALLRKDEGWKEYPLGVFVLSSPSKRDSDYHVIRDVDAYDLSYVLDESTLVDPLLIPKGLSYLSVVESLLTSSGIRSWEITRTNQRTQRDLEFKEGTPKLDVINEILSQVGYTSLSFTSLGLATSIPVYEALLMKPTHVYSDVRKGNIIKGAKETKALDGNYNVYKFIRSNEEQPPVSYVFVNNNPEDPLSVQNLGREVVYTEVVTDVAEEGALKSKALMKAMEDSFRHSEIEFRTPIIPNHCCYNIIDFEYSPLSIKGEFMEVKWSFPLKVGGEMSHTLQAIDRRYYLK